MENKQDWTYVNTLNDFKPLLNCPDQFWIVLSRFGKILCAKPYDVSFDDNGDITDISFASCCSGPQGDMYSSCTQIIAYKPINITQDLLDIVNSTKKGQNSILGKTYSQRYPIIKYGNAQ